MSRAIRWPYLIPLAIVAIGWPVLVPAVAVGDSFTFWSAGHLVASGKSPYDRAAWEAMATLAPPASTVPWLLARLDMIWLYPPQTALLFAPFGALPVQIGSPLIQVFVLAATAIGVLTTARVAGLSGARLGFALSAAALAEPVALGIRGGQPVGLVLLGAALAFVGARDRRALPLVVGVGLLSVKPHIVLAFSAGLAIYLARRDRRLLVVAVGTVAALTAASTAITPFPVDAVGRAFGDRRSFDVATTLALARDMGDGLAVAAAVALVSAAAAIAAWRSAPAAARAYVGLAAALAVSLVVAPFAHDHDQTILVPALFAVVLLVRGARYEVALDAAILAVAVVAPWAYLVTRLITRNDLSNIEGPLGALPVIALIGLAVASSSAHYVVRSATLPGSVRE